jgi:hypothetical protein
VSDDIYKNIDNDLLIAISELYDEIRKGSIKIAGKWKDKSPDKDVLRWYSQRGRNAALIKDVNQLRPTYKKIDDTIKQMSYDYYPTTYAFESFITVNAFRDLGYNIKIKKYSSNQFEEAIKNALSKYSNPNMIEADRNASLNRIYQVIKTGLIEGTPLEKINRKIDIELGYRDRTTNKLINKPSKYKGDFYKRMVVLRTESNRMKGLAETDNYINTNRQGIKKDLILVEVMDNRTRPQSAQMDGQKADENGYFTFPDGRKAPRGNSGNPAWDINDRSTTITMMPEDNIKDYARSERIKEDIEIKPYRNFYDYAKDIGLKKNKYGQVLFPEAK